MTSWPQESIIIFPVKICVNLMTDLGIFTLRTALKALTTFVNRGLLLKPLISEFFFRITVYYMQ